MVNAKASTATAPAWTLRHTLGLGLVLAGIVSLELLMPVALRVVAWGSMLALLAVFTLIVGHGVTGRWLGVLIDATHKMSLSRLQMLLWTFLVLSGLLTAVTTNIAAGVREPLAITVPAPLWLLMGISTASMVGSPILQTIQQNRAASTEAKPQARPSFDSIRFPLSSQSITDPSIDTASLADLFTGSASGTVGLIDIGQTQMFFFALILQLAYGSSLARLFSTAAPILALPTLDVGMVALLSISHAGFLVNQAVSPKG